MFAIVTPDKVEENHRLYWKIKNVFPRSTEFWMLEGENVGRGKLHDDLWELTFSFHYIGNIRVSVKHYPCGPPSPHSPQALFIARVGICGESQEVVAETQNLQNLFGWKSEELPIHRSELESMMQENKVWYFYLEIKKRDYQKTQTSKEPKTRKQKIERDFSDMFLSGKYSDLTIEVNNKKFKCHKFILEARSLVFSAMMEHDMKEKASGIVTIEDAEPTTFREFLLYLYTGNEEHLDWKNVVQLYKLGDKYAVDDLKSVCLEHMKRNISGENIFELFLLSQQHNELKLSEAAIQFFVKNAKKIVETEDWDMFLKNNSNEANVLMKAVVINK